MADIAAVEGESRVTTLSPEQVKTAAGSIKNFLQGTFSSWPEYKDPRLLEQAGVQEFTRPQGQPGAGSWEVTNYGPFIECDLENPGGK